MRFKAARALHRYNRAEQHYLQLESRRNALKARHSDFIQEWAIRIAETPCIDLSSFERELLQIDECMQELVKSWQQAHSNLYLAYQNAISVLHADEDHLPPRFQS